MPAPAVIAVRVPFYYAAPPPSDGYPNDNANTDNTFTQPPVFVTHANIEVIAFGDRFFWLHVSESPATHHVPRLGACSVSVGLFLHALIGSGNNGNNTSSTSTSALIEFEAARPQDMSAGTNTTVQSLFASSLSQKLVRGVAKRFQKQVTVYVNCAIEGERCLALLGTDGGSGFDMTFQFGALVYREAFVAVAKHLESVGSH